MFLKKNVEQERKTKNWGCLHFDTLFVDYNVSVSVLCSLTWSTACRLKIWSWRSWCTFTWWITPNHSLTLPLSLLTPLSRYILTDKETMDDSAVCVCVFVWERECVCVCVCLWCLCMLGGGGGKGGGRQAEVTVPVSSLTQRWRERCLEKRLFLYMHYFLVLKRLVLGF